jgi:hypothetical protein
VRKCRGIPRSFYYGILDLSASKILTVVSCLGTYVAQKENVRTCVGRHHLRLSSRVATKVGFHNFAKYEISRNTLLISRNFAKFREIYRYEFREISARNLISRNSARFSH